jgi:hypothetical protein
LEKGEMTAKRGRPKTRKSARKKAAKKAARKKKAPAKKKAAQRKRRRRPEAKEPAPEPVSPLDSSAPVPHPQETFLDRGEAIPDEYGADRITAMVRDPNWIFVYWELAGQRRDEITETYGPQAIKNLQWVLRVRNLSDGTHQDIPVLLDSKNWYLNVKSGRSYAVELGIITREHEFVSFVRSNQVATPPGGASSQADEQWMVKDRDFEKFLAMYGEVPAGGSPTRAPGGISSGGLAGGKKK